MKLTTLIESLGTYRLPCGLNDFEVKGITSNSKNVDEDFVFVAIDGTKHDGHKFVGEAVNKGAAAVVSKYKISDTGLRNNISLIQVDDTRKILGALAARFYGYPSSSMKVVGVTGTNGKTTITYLLEAILKKNGVNPAVIGTVNYRFKEKVVPSQNTTPGPVELQQLLAEASSQGANYTVMEVSSHSLHQHRTEGIDFHSAIFINLTQDHLDYHKNKEDYFQAKAKLFNNLKAGAFAVINQDDAYGRRLIDMVKTDIITFGIDKDSDVTAKDIYFTSGHTEFTLKTPDDEMRLRTGLIGQYNVYNILAAAAWGIKEDISISAIKEALSVFYSVPGRLEKVPANNGVSVLVDYAHTEDALRNVISALRQVAEKSIIVVFGCGGERDKTKRPKMGLTVSELADFAIITNDNPRSEEPENIIEDIKRGIKKDNYCVIPERRDAIGKALSLARIGDIVLVAGKGHENYQILKDKTIPFDDREVARECLASMNL